ncbi:MAG: tape measure protein [Proteobacteria bacterium]|nr:tape measure protein [Pseudomonadota bacterium]
MSGEIRAKVIIDGDPKGLRTALAQSEADLAKLDATGRKVQILEGAIQNAKDARAAMLEARTSAQTLDEQLASAKGAGAGKEAIKLLEQAVKSANAEVKASETAWEQSRQKLDAARSAASAAGVDTRNLASEQSRLKAETEAAAAAVQRSAQALEDAARASQEKLAQDRAAAAEEQRLAQIVEMNTTRQRLAAQELLEAERKAYAEAETASARATAAREAEARAVEAFAARTKKALSDSFSAVGIRGSAEIQAEILNIQQSLLKLGASAKISGADFDRAFAEAKTRIAALEAEMNGVVPAIDRVGTGAKGLKGDFAALAGQFAGIAIAMQAGQAFITANSQMESLSRTLKQLTGDSTKAAAELEYIRGAANRMGLDVLEASKSYTQLLAATKGTALEGDSARKVFEAVAGAMASLGKSSAETNNALMAVNQMASKGTVQMEELKGQLGEALPGALKAAADGAGLTVSEMSKMIESGEVLAEDLLPALAKGLTEMYGVGKTNNDTFVASWARLKNTVTDTLQVIGDSGVFKVLTQTVSGATQALGVFTVGAEASAKKIGVMAAAIANGDFGLKGFSDRAKQALGEIDIQTEKSLQKITQASSGASTGIAGAGKAAEDAGKKAADSSSGWLAAENAYSQVEQASKKQIDRLKTLQDAADSGGAAMKAFADVFGTQVEKLTAATQAAKAHEDASRALADQVKADLEIAKAKLVSLEQERDANGKLTDAKEKLREKLQDTILTKQAEADKTEQATAAAHSATLQAEAATAVFADHAKQVYALRDAWQAAEAEYQRLSVLNSQGVSVSKELKAADEARAKALLLYRDALSDATAAAERHVAAEKSAASIQQSALQNDLYRANTILEVAKQRGNEKEIAQAQIAVWRIELEINEAQALASRKEAEAMELVAKAKRAELEASGGLTEAKKAELALADANVKAKQLEAEKYDLVADRMRKLSYETNELKSSFGDLSSSADQAAASADRAAASYDGLASSIRSAGQAKDGFVRNTNGEIVTTGPDVAGLAVKNTQTPEQAKIFEEVFNFYYQKASQDPSNYSSMQGLQYGAIERAAAAAAAAEAQRRTSQSSGSASSASSSSSGASSYPLNGQTIKIDITGNGGSAAAYVNDQASADALVRILKSSLAGRS